MDYIFDKRNLEAEMIRNDVSRMDLARTLNISYTTINAKFNGLSEWGYAECLKIRDEFFPDFKVDDIFRFYIRQSTA